MHKETSPTGSLKNVFRIFPSSSISEHNYYFGTFLVRYVFVSWHKDSQMCFHVASLWDLRPYVYYLGKYLTSERWVLGCIITKAIVGRLQDTLWSSNSSTPDKGSQRTCKGQPNMLHMDFTQWGIWANKIIFFESVARTLCAHLPCVSPQEILFDPELEFKGKKLNIFNLLCDKNL